MLTETIFFFGIVEDVNDPLKLGRVRVRAYGYHTENKQLIPTERLPWSPVVISNSAGVSGVGYSSTGIVSGSFVFGAFTDADMQSSIVLGSLHASPEQLANPELGFNDPSGTFPRYANESDVNKLARGENALTNALISSKGWSEPKSAYAAKYPHNSVYESVSGHVYEFDDTPGAERIRLWHKAGSFFEYHPDGKLVDKTVNDRYTITLGNEFSHVDGNFAHAISGDYKLSINSTFDISAGSIEAKANQAKFDIATVEFTGIVDVKTMVKTVALDAQSITTKSIVAAGGSVGSSSVQQLFLSSKSKVPLTPANSGHNDPAVPRVEISAMKASTIIDEDNKFFTKSDEVSYAADSADDVKEKALVGVKSLTTNKNANGEPELSFYVATGDTDEDKAGTTETDETGTYLYDAIGTKFKLATLSGESAGDLDGGEF